MSKYVPNDGQNAESNKDVLQHVQKLRTIPGEVEQVQNMIDQVKDDTESNVLDTQEQSTICIHKKDVLNAFAQSTDTLASEILRRWLPSLKKGTTSTANVRVRRNLREQMQRGMNKCLEEIRNRINETCPETVTNRQEWAGVRVSAMAMVTGPNIAWLMENPWINQLEKQEIKQCIHKKMNDGFRILEPKNLWEEPTETAEPERPIKMSYDDLNTISMSVLKDVSLSEGELKQIEHWKNVGEYEEYFHVSRHILDNTNAFHAKLPNPFTMEEYDEAVKLVETDLSSDLGKKYKELDPLEGRIHSMDFLQLKERSRRVNVWFRGERRKRTAQRVRGITVSRTMLDQITSELNKKFTVSKEVKKQIDLEVMSDSVEEITEAVLEYCSQLEAATAACPDTLSYESFLVHLEQIKKTAAAFEEKAKLTGMPLSEEIFCQDSAIQEELEKRVTAYFEAEREKRKSTSIDTESELLKMSFKEYQLICEAVYLENKLSAEEMNMMKDFFADDGVKEAKNALDALNRDLAALEKELENDFTKKEYEENFRKVQLTFQKGHQALLQHEDKSKIVKKMIEIDCTRSRIANDRALTWFHNQQKKPQVSAEGATLVTKEEIQSMCITVNMEVAVQLASQDVGYDLAELLQDDSENGKKFREGKEEFQRRDTALVEALPPKVSHERFVQFMDTLEEDAFRPFADVIALQEEEIANDLANQYREIFAQMRRKGERLFGNVETEPNLSQSEKVHIEISSHSICEMFRKVTDALQMKGDDLALYTKKIKTPQGQEVNDAVIEYDHHSAKLLRNLPEFVSRKRCAQLLEDLQRAQASIIAPHMQKLGTKMVSIFQKSNEEILRALESELEKMFASVEKKEQNLSTKAEMSRDELINLLVDADRRAELTVKEQMREKGSRPKSRASQKSFENLLRLVVEEVCPERLKSIDDLPRITYGINGRLEGIDVLMPDRWRLPVDQRTINRLEYAKTLEEVLKRLDQQYGTYTLKTPEDVFRRCIENTGAKSSRLAIRRSVISDEIIRRFRKIPQELEAFVRKNRTEITKSDIPSQDMWNEYIPMFECELQTYIHDWIPEEIHTDAPLWGILAFCGESGHSVSIWLKNSGYSSKIDEIIRNRFIEQAYHPALEKAFKAFAAAREETDSSTLSGSPEEWPEIDKSFIESIIRKISDDQQSKMEQVCAKVLQSMSPEEVENCSSGIGSYTENRRNLLASLPDTVSHSVFDQYIQDLRSAYQSANSSISALPKDLRKVVRDGARNMFRALETEGKSLFQPQGETKEAIPNTMPKEVLEQIIGKHLNQNPLPPEKAKLLVQMTDEDGAVDYFQATVEHGNSMTIFFDSFEDKITLPQCLEYFSLSRKGFSRIHAKGSNIFSEEDNKIFFENTRDIYGGAEQEVNEWFAQHAVKRVIHSNDISEHCGNVAVQWAESWGEDALYQLILSSPHVREFGEELRQCFARAEEIHHAFPRTMTHVDFVQSMTNLCTEAFAPLDAVIQKMDEPLRTQAAEQHRKLLSNLLVIGQKLFHSHNNES